MRISDWSSDVCSSDLILNGAVIMAFGIVLLELDVHQGKGGLVALTNALRGVLRSPLVLSAAAGLLVSGLGIPLPNAVGTFCDLLGASAGPCALFAIGLFMVGKSPTAGMTEVSWLVFLKQIGRASCRERVCKYV